MGSPEKLAVFLVCIFNFVLITESVNPNCNYYQYLQTGTVYWFPASSPVQFQAGADCLWYAESVSGTRISLNCTIKMPTTLRCSGDRLMVSVNGDANYMSDASYHCGTKTFTVVSNSNSMAIALKGTSGGTFYCSLQTVTQSTSCDCGWRRSTRIVNGVNSGINEYPATAAMIDTSLAAVKCGSIIVSNRFVLTAAHCMRAITLNNMAVLVGDWDLYTGSDTPAAAIYQVLDYTEHPNFNDNTKKNDIAIVRTLTEITFSLLVGPICLPFAYEYTTFDNQDVTMLGWGELFFNGPMADILQKVVVQVITNNACNSAYGGNITQNQMCTYTPNKDSCQGDSGGPLFWQNPSTGRVYVVGIISYGYGCATTKPGVSTRVTSYLQWIVSKINAIPFCVK